MTGRRNPTPWNRDVLSIQPQRFARIAKPTIFARATTDVPVSSTYNSMYTTHTTEDHNTWRKEMDEKKRIRREGGTYVPTNSNKRPSVGETGGGRKKLTLSERLQAVLVTKG